MRQSNSGEIETPICFRSSTFQDSNDVDACPTVAGEASNCCPSKGKILIESGVDTKGTQNAPGLREGFNPKGKGGERAGKKK